MLREIFRTVPIPYKTGPRPPLDYGANTGQYLETLASVWGLSTQLDPLPNSPESIFVWASMHTAAWPSWGFGYWRFNAKTGEFIKRVKPSGGGQSLFLSGGITTSRRRDLWFHHIYGMELLKVTTGATATMLVGDEDEPAVPDDSWAVFYDTPLNISKFHGRPGGDPNSFGAVAIDEIADFFLNIHNRTMYVYRWGSGEYVYEYMFPSGVSTIALEDSGRAYVLFGTRALMLFDYVRNEVLGVSKIAPSVGPNRYGYGTTMTWDPVFRRILTCEMTPNAPDGASTTVVRGFRQVPEPVRLTYPIPLQAPRQRRTIPVLVQALGDLNEGVGNYVLEAKVTGSGSLVGIPITDGYGSTILQVACEGSPFFAASGGDWASTGSPEAEPPHTGLVKIDVKARVYAPDPADVPVSGVPGPGTGPGGGPGPPGSGGGKYIWAWDDKGGDTPDAPGTPSGAPTTMAQWESYFFDLIKRKKGEPANDYQAVLNKLKDQGMKVNPAKDEIPDESWPFYGISVMIDAAGNPRGRIWLPSSVDSNNDHYYTHEIQVIADDPDPDDGELPETAPDMRHILQRVYDEGSPNGPWKFGNGNAYDQVQPDGRGAFTEKAVAAIHDVDARFGHIRKNPGQNQYNHHAVDALIFKNDDGVTGEIFDIASDHGIQWHFVSRDDQVSKWYYPA